jgi:hypothetical protein
MNPLMGKRISVAATWDMNTMSVSRGAPFTVNGVKQSKSKLKMVESKLKIFLKLKERSTTGPHRNLKVGKVYGYNSRGDGYRSYLSGKNGRTTVKKLPLFHKSIRKI